MGYSPTDCKVSLSMMRTVGRWLRSHALWWGLGGWEGVVRGRIRITHIHEDHLPPPHKVRHMVTDTGRVERRCPLYNFSC